jgi:hypothetical protein
MRKCGDYCCCKQGYGYTGGMCQAVAYPR